MNPAALIADPAEVIVPTDIEPLKPVAGHWTKLRQPPEWEGMAVAAWHHGSDDLGVISTLSTAEDRPVYLLAINRAGHRRPSTTDCQRVLLQFGVPRAEEVRLPESGFVRHFVAPIPEAAH